MKKISNILLLTLVILSTNAFAQQIPLLNHYTINPYLSNPAMAGENGTNLFGISRTQWVDVNGAPETYLLTLDGAIPDKRVGLGLTVYSDVVNILGKTGVMGTYSYKLPINKTSRISFGLSLGMEQNKLMFNRLITEEPVEITLINNVQQDLDFDGNFGVNYSTEKLDIGLSVFQLFANKNVLTDDLNFKKYQFAYTRHFLGTVSYNAELKPDVFYLKPFAQVRFAQDIKPQVDVAVLGNYKQKVWIGAGYRLDYGMNFQAGALLADKLTVGYSYGMSVGDITRLSATSHEVLLGVKLAKSARADRDKDGVMDFSDREPETRHWKHIKAEKPFLDASKCIVDQHGVAKDTDKDGVPDCVDKELLSPFGAPVDEDGVALDDDKDGVANLYDREPNTPFPCEVDLLGIALDGDKDGVPNCKDDELDSPFGAPVDAFGVALDGDKDGVSDLFDFEPDSPEGCVVDKLGICNTNAKSGDADGDGVPDEIDLQPETPVGARVDDWGRALVGDGDPYRNKIDLKDIVDNDPDWDYYVIVGVFRYWDNVKRYQKHLVKHYAESTNLLVTQQNFYYVWTKQVYNREQAVTENARLKQKNIEEYIVGNPWLWKEPKKK